MNAVFWAALGIGGTTLIGTGCGFLFEHVSPRGERSVTAFAAGVMLAAAVFGLFSPAMEMAAGWQLLLIPAGAVFGMLFLRGIACLSERMGCGGLSAHPELLFVLALALHKFPEGMAGGVGMGGIPTAAAVMVAIGISLQNLPEGVVMIPPLLNAGVSRFRAAMIALATGLLNAAGVLAGALWGRISGGILPFALAFAGGAMLDVIITQMIPQSCGEALRHGEWIVTGGFLLMLLVNAVF